MITIPVKIENTFNVIKVKSLFILSPQLKNLIKMENTFKFNVVNLPTNEAAG